MSIPYWFGCYGFLGCAEVKYYDASSFVLFIIMTPLSILALYWFHGHFMIFFYLNEQ
jgi:hypothetical protein